MTDIPVNTTDKADKASATMSRRDLGGPQMREDVTNSPGLTSESASEPGQDAPIQQVGGNSTPFSADGSLPGDVSWSATPDGSGADSPNDDGHNVQTNFGDDHITGRKDQSHRGPAHGGKGRADVTARPAAVNRARPAAKTPATTTPNEVANNSKASSDSAAASPGAGRVGTDSTGQSDKFGGQTGSAAPRADQGSSGNDPSKSVNSTADSSATTQNADGITQVSLPTENKAQADANAPLSEQEAWDAAKKGAADWAKERAIKFGVDTLLGPVLAHVFSRPIQDALKGPEPPEPSTPRERETRENYDAMQRTLDVATFAGSIALGGIAGTESELRAARNAAKGVGVAQAGIRGARGAAASSRAANAPHEPTKAATQPKPVATAPPPEAAAPPANPEAPVAPKPATPEAASPPIVSERPGVTMKDGSRTANAPSDVKPDVPIEWIFPIDKVGTRKGEAFAPKVNNEAGGYRGITPKMRREAQRVGETYQGPGEYDVGHRTPLSQTPPNTRVRLRSEEKGPNRGDGNAIAKSNEMRQKAGLYTRTRTEGHTAKAEAAEKHAQPASERAAAHEAEAANPTGDPARPRIGLRAEDHFDQVNTGTAPGPRIDITAPAEPAPESSQPERKGLRR